MSRGGSKVVTGIISFILGFLFAIIVELGAIAGAVWFVMNKDLDTVMSTLGLNNRDEDGNSKYINTDPDKGGVTNIKELISGVKGLVYDNGELVIIGKSFDEISNLIPATDMLLSFVYKTVDEYIEIDHDEFESTQMSNLPQLLSDSVMQIKTAALLEKLGMTDITGEAADAIVKSLVTGAETEYAYIAGAAMPEGGQAVKFPVLYDYYTYDTVLNWYFRLDGAVSGTDTLPDNLKDRANNDPDGLFTKVTVNDEERFALYYVPCRVTDSGIEEASYSYDVIEKIYGTGDNAKTNKITRLVFGEDTDFIVVTPDANGKFSLNYADIYGALDAAHATDYSYRFKGYSYDTEVASEYYYIVDDKDNGRYEMKTRCGKNYFRDNSGAMINLDALTLQDIVNDPYAPLDNVAVTEVLGKDEGDVAYKIFKKTSLGDLMRGTVNFDKLVEDIELSAVVTDVTTDNKIMSYIVYKLSDFAPLSDGLFTATYDDGEGGRRVYVTTETTSGGKNKINGVYERDAANVADCTPVAGVKFKEVSALANGMAISVFMDVKADDAISSYVAYGLYSVNKAADGSVDALGNAYSYTGKIKTDGGEKDCYIQVSDGGENKISSVWYVDSGKKVYVGGSKVGEVAARIDGFTEDLTIGEVLGVTGSSNPLMNAIKNTKICNLESKIAGLTVDEVVSEQDMNGSSLLKQLKGVKVSELGKEIDNIMVQRIYAEEVYGKDNMDKNGDPKRATAFDPELLYYVKDGNGAFKLYDVNAKARSGYGTPGFNETVYDEELGHVTKAQFEADGAEFYTYGKAKGMWKIILYARNTNEGAVDAHGDKLARREKAYTLNNFNNMVAESALNVNGATLYELKDAGIINSSVTDGQLAKKLSGQSKTLGEMTLEELITAAINLAS